MRLPPLVATILAMVLTTSRAWVITSRVRYAAVHRTNPAATLRQMAGGNNNNRRRSNLQASKNSEDSSAASTATLPKFSSFFNRTDALIDNANDDTTKSSPYSVQQRTITTKFSNSDADIENFGSSDSATKNESILLATSALAVAVAAGLYATDTPLDPSAIVAGGSSLVGSARDVLADPGAALDQVVELTDSMGDLGIAYFGVAYCIAEILAIPAIPLTASAGYLFGPVKGTAIVLLSASVAAGVSFAIGRTLLREYVEGVLVDYPKFAKLDKAIGREGFKLMLLLRLSPIFPFALSNYLYGASSINFSAFFGGTLLGFAPGTIAYVYTGYVGKALTGDAGSDVYPWYVYLGGLTLFAGLLKVVADTATRVVEEIEAEEEAQNSV